MSAKQVSSGYILWKTGPEPVRHSHSGERPAFDCRPPPELPKHTGGKFYQAGNTPPSAVWGEQAPSASAHSKEIFRDSAVGGKLFQPVPAPKKRLENSAEKAGLFQLVSIQRKFPGIVWKRSGCPVGACSREIPGSSAGGGRLPQTGLFKETSKK